MQYQVDDLIYDIEIRKNLFVITQFYPAQHKFVISYLEGLNKYLQLFKPEDEQFEHGDLLTDYTKGIRALTYLSNTSKLSNYQFLTQLDRQFKQSGQPYQELINRTIKAWYHPFTQSEKLHEYLVDYIDKENPSLSRSKNNTYEFENLANPDDFIKFAARYGLADNWKNAIEGWTNRRLTTPSTTNNRQAGFFDNLNNLATLTYSNHPISDYYYPVKDLDLKDGNLPEKASQGLRIGYNSQSYDETMIAHILGECYQGVDNLLNLAPDAWQYFLENYPDAKNVNWEQPIEGTQIRLIDALRLCSLRDFYNHLDDLMPNKLANFNSQMFTENFMPSALSRETPQFGRISKKAYDLSNRYIDVMKLLPKPQSLKMLAGMFGFQIKESESNTDPDKEQPTQKDMADVIAYNVSDVYVTHQVFQLGGFQSTYSARTALINQYPMLNWKHDDRDTIHKMAVAENNPLQVRSDRVTVNTTNPRIMENIIAPYPNTKLIDKPVVDFMYPAPEVAEENHVKPFDVLEDTMKYAKENIPDGENVFRPIYDYYAQFRGRNFNPEQSAAIINQQKVVSWKDDQMQPLGADIIELKQHANTAPLTENDDICYIDSDGQKQRIKYTEFTNGAVSKLKTKNVFGDYVEVDPADPTRVIPSRGYYNASIGGIHGAEDKIDVYQMQIEYQTQRQLNLLAAAQNNNLVTESTPEDLLAEYSMPYEQEFEKYHKKKLQGLIHRIKQKTKNAMKKNNGQQFTKVLRSIIKPLTDKHNLNDYITFHKDGSITIKFAQPINRWAKKKLKDAYAYTSIGKARHQDFNSYYPTLTVRLRIAVNVDGIDQYRNIYEDRLHNKAESKNPKNSPEVQKMYKDKQKPQKLLLNSLTGIADAKGKMRSKVRVNNRILQMRIIGQLFAWRIGQALTLAGAKIVSTNTDGLYTQNIDEKTNDKVVNEQTEHMLLKVGPEEIDNFISKDANNRIEIKDGKINEAKGGTLTAWQGPDWTKTLSHPALNDRVLAEYLFKYPDSVNHEFNREFAKKLLFNFRDKLLAEDDGQRKFLNFLQWIMRSNYNSKQFIFAHRLTENGQVDYDQEPIYLEQTNRLYLLTEKGNELLNVNSPRWSLFKAGPASVSTRTGVITHIKESLQSSFHGKMNGKLIQALINWRNDIMPTDFINNDKLCDAFIKDFWHQDIELQKQDLFADNDPLAYKVMTHYLSEDQLYDPDDGIWGQCLTTLSPNKNAPKRNKIIDITLAKINDFPENHPVYIDNHAIADYSNDLKQTIIDNVDYDAYLTIVENKFTKNWQN